MPHSPFAPPPQEPCGWRYDLLPGPLSPAWPVAAAPARPGDEFLALAEELLALRGVCVRSLDTRRGEGPLLLSRAERQRLNDICAMLKAENAGLPHHVRLSAPTRWPAPVLPENALFGARDLLGLLDTAAAVAREVGERRARQMAAQALVA